MQTIYNAVGPKSTLLSAVLDRAASGPLAPQSVPEFMSERSAQLTDATAMADMLADWLAEVQPRVAGINRVIREAAATDPAVAQWRFVAPPNGSTTTDSLLMHSRHCQARESLRAKTSAPRSGRSDIHRPTCSSRRSRGGPSSVIATGSAMTLRNSLIEVRGT